MDQIQDELLPPEARHRTREFLDARDLPPPQPLQRTLERLVDIDTDSAFVQLNDRVPQMLFPKLEQRGFEYESAETAEGIQTVIWRPAE